MDFKITNKYIKILRETESSSLGATYVREVSKKDPDSIFITHIQENDFQIEVNQWKNGLKKSKSTTGTLDKNKLYYENGKIVILTENNKF